MKAHIVYKIYICGERTRSLRVLIRDNAAQHDYIRNITYVRKMCQCVFSCKNPIKIYSNRNLQKIKYRQYNELYLYT